MSSSTSVRFPDALKAEAMAYADALGISLNALCAVALRDYLDQRKQGAAQAGGAPAPTRAPPATPAVASPAPVPARAPAESRTPTSGRGGPAASFWAKPAAGVNAPCPCGSGQKWKKCHGAPDARG